MDLVKNPKTYSVSLPALVLIALVAAMCTSLIMGYTLYVTTTNATVTTTKLMTGVINAHKQRANEITVLRKHLGITLDCKRRTPDKDCGATRLQADMDGYITDAREVEKKLLGDF